MSDLLLIAVNAAVSFLTIKLTMNSELKKMKFQYNRDDDLAIKDAYSEMRAAVTHYLTSDTGTFQRKAQTALSKFIALAPLAMQPLLQDMHKHLLKQTVNASEIKTDLQAIDDAWQSYRATRTKIR